MNKDQINQLEQFRKTKIVAYDIEWPLLYETEQRRIKAILKNDLVAIHHIGSTAVPGMLAKPVIDIMVLVNDIHILQNYKVDLESMGYHWMGEYSIPGRRYLWRIGDKTDFHLQCFQHDHIAATNCLVFRNFLISHPEKAIEYGKVKELASKKFPDDTHAYWYEKKSAVDRLLDEALPWYNKKKSDG
jgi:GrpB-like predicted nucleotidyltransferase (UPF0157 family)